MARPPRSERSRVVKDREERITSLLSKMGLQRTQVAAGGWERAAAWRGSGTQARFTSTNYGEFATFMVVASGRTLATIQDRMPKGRRSR